MANQPVNELAAHFRSLSDSSYVRYIGKATELLYVSDINLRQTLMCEKDKLYGEHIAYYYCYLQVLKLVNQPN